MKEYIAKISTIEPNPKLSVEISLYAKTRLDAQRQIDEIIKKDKFVHLLRRDENLSSMRTKTSNSWSTWHKLLSIDTLKDYCKILISRLDDLNIDIRDNTIFADSEYNSRAIFHIKTKRAVVIDELVLRELIERYEDKEAIKTKDIDNKIWYRIVEADALIHLGSI